MSKSPHIQFLNLEKVDVPSSVTAEQLIKILAALPPKTRIALEEVQAGADLVYPCSLTLMRDHGIAVLKGHLMPSRWELPMVEGQDPSEGES